MSEIQVEPRNYKKLTLILIIFAVAIISFVFMGIGFNWFGITASDGGGG